METHFPDNVMAALKDAVLNVFWRKQDVRALLQRCAVPSKLVNEQDWQAYKIHIVSPILDCLNAAPKGLGPLRRILQETLAYTDGDHLLWMADGPKQKKEAERSLEHLRLLVKDHDAVRKTEGEERQRRLRAFEEARRGAAFLTKLAEIRDRFLRYLQGQERQSRGYAEACSVDLMPSADLGPQLDQAVDAGRAEPARLPKELGFRGIHVLVRRVEGFPTRRGTGCGESTLSVGTFAARESAMGPWLRLFSTECGEPGVSLDGSRHFVGQRGIALVGDRSRKPNLIRLIAALWMDPNGNED